jgi:uncharacterized membrane protein
VPNSSAPRPGAPSASAPAGPPPSSRAIPATLLVLALAGLAIAMDLWVLHVRAHAGAGPSFCDIDGRVSCSKVALSSWSVLLGVPNAAWGALA